MRFLLTLCLAAVLGLAAPAGAAAEDVVIEDFTGGPEGRWRFFADTVMGGVSSGQIAFREADGVAYGRLTGQVSTANNGGFIQMRRDLTAPPAETAAGVRLVVRGNGQRYFVHLRTTGTVLPWQYYQAGFDATPDWREVRLPFEAFERSGMLLRRVPRAASLTSIGIVAFGRDHEAEVEVRAVGFYGDPPAAP